MKYRELLKFLSQLAVFKTNVLEEKSVAKGWTQLFLEVKESVANSLGVSVYNSSPERSETNPWPKHAFVLCSAANRGKNKATNRCYRQRGQQLFCYEATVTEGGMCPQCVRRRVELRYENVQTPGTTSDSCGDSLSPVFMGWDISTIYSCPCHGRCTQGLNTEVERLTCVHLHRFTIPSWRAMNIPEVW